MKKLLICMTMLLGIVLVTVNANAITIADIDGFDNGEWATPWLSAVDANEGTIIDNYDIWKIGMILENNADANDGLYIGWLLYSTPTFAPYPTTGSARPIYRTILDFDLNGIEDGNDRRIEYAWVSSAPVITVYDALGNVVAGTPLAAYQTVGANAGVEWFVPKNMFSSFPMSKLQTFSILDNGGQPGEDYLPDVGWSSTVPEPGTAMLLGFGLMGLVGGVIRRRKVTA